MGLLQSVGKCIRTRRLELGLSQEELAFRSGLHRTYISFVEHGRKNVSLESLERLAAGLNCSVRELIPDTRDNDNAR